MSSIVLSCHYTPGNRIAELAGEDARGARNERRRRREGDGVHPRADWSPEGRSEQ